MRKVVTIDGLAASGKSSIAKALAEKTGFIHLNTGALYRAATFLFKQSGLPASEENLKRILGDNTIQLDMVGQTTEVLINQVPTINLLYDNAISTGVSEVSAMKSVRDALLDLQRDAFPNRNIIAEGRDMGTVVFPAADMKFFINADPEVRARRRVGQLEFNEELLAQVKSELLARDRRDQTREVAPAVPAKDAVIIDNSTLKLTEVVENIYHLLLEKGLVP